MADSDNVENIYALLGIDSSIQLSATEARQRIHDAVELWQKQSTFPGHKGETVRIKRDQWNHLSQRIQFETISDQQLDILLEQHRYEQRSAAERASAASRRRFPDEVKFAALKGHILQREIDAWEMAYKDIVPLTEIEQMANQYPRKSQSGKPLSDDKLNEIDKALNTLGEESLFSLVKAQAHDSDDVVRQRAEKLYTEGNQRAAEAKWSIKKNLAGDVKAIFTDPAHAQQYRAHVRQQQFYRMYLQPVEVTCNVTHEITTPQADHLLDLAAKDHWNRDEAIEALFALAYQHGWRVLPPSTGALENEKRLLQEFKQQLSLRDRQVAAAEKRAAITQNEMDKLAREVQESERQFKAAQDIAKVERERLERKLQEAEKRAQAEADAGQMRSNDARQREEVARLEAQKLRQELAEWKRREAENERERFAQVGPLLAAHISRANLIAAQGIIKSFPTIPPQWAGDAQRVERDIGEAKRLLAEAQNIVTQVAQAEALVDEALAKCADFEPAHVFKASLPPAPPSNLIARDESGAAVLTWEPSPSRNVRYVVVRSIGTKPLSAHDGSRLTDITECAWRDTDAPPARPLWYAIFAERGSAVSNQSATASAALTLLPDVSDVQVEVSDGQVVLTWRLHRGVHSIRIVRNEDHTPQSISDGHSLLLGQTSRYEDTGLVNGQQHFYRVYCEYTGLDGRIARSEGVGAIATPTPPPSAIPTLLAHGVDGITNHTVYLDTPTPEHGDLVIYRTSAAPTINAGATAPVTQHKHFFRPDRHEITGNRDTLFSAGAYFYTPVILFQQTAFIGQPELYFYCPAIHTLRVTDTAMEGIQLRWLWPSRKCDTAEVRCQMVATNSSEPMVHLVRRVGEEEKEGAYALRNLARGDYKISVLARYQFQQQIVYSSEETKQLFHSPPVRVRYALQTQRKFITQRSVLVLTADQPVSLPDIHIVYGRGPLTMPSDGRMLCDFSPDSPLPASTWTVNLPEFTAEPDARIHIFHRNATMEAEVIFERA